MNFNKLSSNPIMPRILSHASINGRDIISPKHIVKREIKIACKISIKVPC